MDMRAPKPEHPRLGDLFDRLVDEGGNLLHAEIRIAEAKLTRRARMAAMPAGQLAAAVALALIALFAVATAIVVALAPVIGFVASTLLVGAAAALAAYILYRKGSEGLREVFEMPGIGDEDQK